MNGIDDKIDRVLSTEEPPVADDGFSESVLSRLPRARRRIDASLARRLTLAGAASIGSLLTLLLGPPIETLFARYAEYGELTSTLLGVAIVVGILVVPIVWLVYTESTE